MTIRSYLMSVFPALHLGCIIFCAAMFFHYFTFHYFLLMVVAIYILPLCCFHLHQLICPLKEGPTNLAAKTYSAWWGVQQIQGLFNAVPFLEAILKIVPGTFSVWLRLWGSKIGKNIYWTAQIEIIDRNLMDVGNNVIFGHKVGCCAHAITSKYGTLLLYVKRVKIGSNVLVGAGSKIGPGAQIADGKMLPALTLVSVNEIIENEQACQLGV